MNRAPSQKGIVGVLAMLFLALIMAVPVAFVISAQSRQKSISGLEDVQAQSAARAGVANALNWFRAQTVQPVAALSNPTEYPWHDAAFYPRSSTTSLGGGTWDESVGLVKEYVYKADTNVYGRYVVRRQQDPGSNPFDADAAHDVTSNRYPARPIGSGYLWSVVSHGILYKKIDPMKDPDQSPNYILSKSKLYAEFIYFNPTPPPGAALAIADAANITMVNATSLNGGADGPAILCAANSGFNANGGSLYGTPTDIQVTPGLALDINAIFGVSKEELRSMATFIADGGTAADLNEGYNQQSIFYLEPGSNVRLEAATNGILFMENGSTVFQGNFRGLVYINGTATLGRAGLYEGMNIQGMVIVNGSVNFPLIDNRVIYDPAVLQDALNTVRGYRLSRSTLLKG